MPAEGKEFYLAELINLDCVPQGIKSFKARLLNIGVSRNAYEKNDNNGCKFCSDG
ncbi:hypothetical protein VrSk94_37880 [Vibrio rotiferianus]